MAAGRATRGPGRAGFTLIELLAVILIFGLVAALVAPPLGLGRDRGIDEAARRIAAACEFARQRAVMTGRPHEVILDLDWVSHRVEWQPPPPDAPPPVLDPGAPIERGNIAMSPPRAAERPAFEPVPGLLGRDAPLPRDALLVEVDVAGTAVRRGEVRVRFEPDGAADAAEIWIGGDDGRARLVVEVRPLADAVLVLDAAA